MADAVDDHLEAGGRRAGGDQMVIQFRQMVYSDLGPVSGRVSGPVLGPVSGHVPGPPTGSVSK